MTDDTSPQGPEPLWAALADLETNAKQKLAQELTTFDAPLRMCYGCGLDAPRLPGGRHAEVDIQLAALFLKRALTDLRTVWLLASSGYTSQAATVTAALFEHAITVAVIAGSPQNASALATHPLGEIPWEPKKLCQLWAKKLRQNAASVGNQMSDDAAEMIWQDRYASYIFLAKIRHPTMRSTSHDALSAAGEPGIYYVMAMPDVRPNDLSLKSHILIIAILACLDAIGAFAQGLLCDTDNERVAAFASRMEMADRLAMEANSSLGSTPLPFDASDDPRARRWHELRERLSRAGNVSE